MNLKFIETFIWVAKLRSFSLAADKQHSTQAAISNRISALEQELGAKLFMREAKGITLTRAGECVLHHAEQVSESISRLCASLHDDKLVSGTLRIGAMDSAIHSWFVEFVNDTAQQFPNLDLEITCDTALILNDQLRRGMLDMVIQTDMLRDETIRSVELLQLPIGWLTASDSHVATHFDGDTPAAALQRLGRERLITFSRHSRPHQDLLRLMQSYSISDAKVSCVNSVTAIIKLTQANFGVAAIPPALVLGQLQTGALRLVSGLGTPPPMSFVIAWRSGVDWTEQLVEIAIETAKKYAARVGADAAHIVV